HQCTVPSCVVYGKHVDQWLKAIKSPVKAMRAAPLTGDLELDRVEFLKARTRSPFFPEFRGVLGAHCSRTKLYLPRYKSSGREAEKRCIIFLNYPATSRWKGFEAARLFGYLTKADT
ncbi:hypothetical protein KUCAC02_026532, partial [Chaenocephalus aceratus]